MSEPEPPPEPADQQHRPVSHRADAPTPLLQRMLAPVTAVAVVAIVVVLLVVINGGSSGTNQSPAAVGSATTTPHPRVTVTRPRATSSPRASRPAVATTAPSHPATAPMTARRSRPPVATAMAPVTVLNNSRRANLAHDVAAEIAAKGWHVARVGNLQGVVPETTVYYAPGLRAAAQHLAAQFASVQRVAPNATGRITGGGLTLVVTRYWAL